MDRAVKVETGSRNKKKFKYKKQSTVLANPRFSEHPEHLLSRKYKYHPFFHSISNLDLNPCFLLVDHKPSV